MNDVMLNLIIISSYLYGLEAISALVCHRVQKKARERPFRCIITEEEVRHRISRHACPESGQSFIITFIALVPYQSNKSISMTIS